MMNSEFCAEQYLPAFLRNSREIMILVTDLEGNIIYVNNAYLDSFRFTLEETIGKNYRSQIFSGDEDIILETVKKCLVNPGIPEKILIRKHKKNQPDFYFSEWEFSAFTNELNEPIGIISIGKNVTDYHPLKSSERDEYLNLINSLTSESWAFYDTELRLKTCNQKAIEIAKKVFGIEPMRGDSAMMYVGEEHKDEMKKAFDMALNGQECQLELVTKNDEFFVINLKPIYNDKNKLIGIGHYCLDVTNLRKNQREINKLNLRFQTLINQLNGIVLILDLEGKIRYISDTVTKFSGFKPEFIQDKNISEFIHPDDLSEVFQSLSQLRDSNDSALVAFRSVNADGSYNWSLGRGTVIEEGGEKYILGVILNIEELRQKDEVIQKHHEKFQQIAWLQSHEVRAPLARLLGLADAIYTDLIEDKDELKQFILHIKQAAYDLDTVIHKIVQMTESNFSQNTK
ncbi:MAG: PAS domain S-box protein [Thermaurantimonas sp.]|uniref:PAS domain S-box protein n=1 Tax=Thermaurantimonas sp. TaxID=2681568 RepID=UPI00391AE2BB